MPLNPEIKRNSLAYLVLVLGLGGLALAFMLAWPERFWLRSIAIILAVYYVAWGWWTHAQHGTVPSKVLAEYAGIGIVGLTLVWLITL